MPSVTDHQQEARVEVAALVRDRGADSHAWALALTADEDEASDLEQAVIARALRHPERVENSDRGVAYLVAGMKKEFLHLRARRATAAKVQARLIELPLRQPPCTPEQEAWRRIVAEALQEAIEQLPPKRREAFLYVRVYGRLYTEAAAEMGCATKTVENHVRLAEAALRRNNRLLRLVASDFLITSSEDVWDHPLD